MRPSLHLLKEKAKFINGESLSIIIIDLITRI